MLDRLPTEVLAQVLDQAAVEWPEDVQACCTVSKSVGGVAQELLWRYVDMYDHKQAQLLAAAVNRERNYGRLTHELYAGGARHGWSANDLLRMMPNLRRLTLSRRIHRFKDAKEDKGGDGVALYGLKYIRMINLQSLPLGPHTLPPCIFPHLRRLSLEDIQTTPHTLEHLLNTTTVPFLRALYLCGLTSIDTGDPIFPDLPSSLLDQLDMLCLACSDLLLDIISPRHLQTTLPVLVVIDEDAEAVTLLDSAIQHVATSPGLQNEDVALALWTVRSMLASDASRLQTLWLPSTLSPTASDTIPLRLGTLTDNVLEECSQRSVRVNWIEEVIGMEEIMDAFEPFGKELRRQEHEKEGKAVRGEAVQ